MIISEPEPVIRIAGLGKSFGAVAALSDVSLDVAPGEFLCLLGPSGCGKTTLLRLLAGFETPDRGRIELDGRDISGEPPHRRPLNMMFQSYALFPHLTAARNVAYGLRWTALGRGEVADRVGEMLRLVRLDGLGDRYPAQLSGGQKQRVALARALARAPRVLLLDEPLAALDPALREDTQAELKRLQATLRTTFVMVTHDQAEALGMADRIVLMDRGRILQVGPPEELYERPANRFAATFLGHMNLVEGRVAAVGGGVVQVATALSDAPLEVAPGVPSRWRIGDAVAVAIRPDRCELARPEGEGRPNVIPGEIVGRTYLGGSAMLRIRARNGSVLRVREGIGGPGRSEMLVGHSNAPPPHAEVRGGAEPRSTHGRLASFEAPPCGAPQDEEVGHSAAASEGGVALAFAPSAAILLD